MKRSCLIFCLFLGLLKTASAQVADTSHIKKYVKVPAGYLMVLREGDDLFAQLEAFAKKEKIPSASFSGMGFAEIKFGSFNSKTKKYNPKKFKAAELGSMQGSLAWQNGKPSIHAHGIIAIKKFKAYGGHMLSATVGTGSMEILITVHDKKFERVLDEKLGANVLCLDKCH